MNSDQARQRAEKSFKLKSWRRKRIGFKKEERAQDAREAMMQYECQAFATGEKTARLKEQRLAKKPRRDR